MTKNWSQYLDQWGFITEGDGDGGDSAQRTGMAYIASRFYYRRMLEGRLPEFLQYPSIWFQRMFYKYLKSPEFGKYIRHPDPDKWYSNPRCMSRDNTFPLILSLSMMNHQEDLQEFKKLIAPRLFFLFNTSPHPQLEQGFVNRILLKLGWKPADFAGISIIGLLYNKVLPLQLTVSLGCITGLIKSIYKSENTSNDINLICSIGYLYLQGRLTGLVRGLAKRYIQKRAQFALDNYFGHPNGCPMNELWRPVIKLLSERL